MRSTRKGVGYSKGHDLCSLKEGNWQKCFGSAKIYSLPKKRKEKREFIFSNRVLRLVLKFNSVENLVLVEHKKILIQISQVILTLHQK